VYVLSENLITRFNFENNYQKYLKKLNTHYSLQKLISAADGEREFPTRPFAHNLNDCISICLHGIMCFSLFPPVKTGGYSYFSLSG
jgi:hypothetical protein